MKKHDGRYDYGWEKLYTAILALAQGDEPLCKRLASVWGAGGLVRLELKHVPPEDRADFSEMVAMMTSAEGKITASASALSDDEARKMVERIISIYTHICRLQESLPRK